MKKADPLTIDVMIENLSIRTRELSAIDGGTTGLGVPQPQRARALVDTGAMISIVTPNIADILRAPRGPAYAVRGLQVARPFAMSGGSTIPSCHVVVRLPVGRITVVAGIAPLHTMDPDLSFIIGRDILDHLVLTYDGPRGVVVLDRP